MSPPPQIVTTSQAACIFSHTTALTEHDLSSLSCVCVCVDQNKGDLPIPPSRTKLTNQSECRISSHNKYHMQYFQTQQNYMLKKKATQPIRMQDFQTQQKPHVTKVWHNAGKALLVEQKDDEFIGPCHLPKFWDKNHQETTKVTIMSYQLVKCSWYFLPWYKLLTSCPFMFFLFWFWVLLH